LQCKRKLENRAIRGILITDVDSFDRAGGGYYNIPVARKKRARRRRETVLTTGCKGLRAVAELSLAPVSTIARTILTGRIVSVAIAVRPTDRDAGNGSPGRTVAGVPSRVCPISSATPEFLTCRLD